MKNAITNQKRILCCIRVWLCNAEIGKKRVKVRDMEQVQETHFRNLLFTHVIRLKHTIKKRKYLSAVNCRRSHYSSAVNCRNSSAVNCRRFHRQLTAEKSNYADNEFCIIEPNHFWANFYL